MKSKHIQCNFISFNLSCETRSHLKRNCKGERANIIRCFVGGLNSLTELPYLLKALSQYHLDYVYIFCCKYEVHSCTLNNNHISNCFRVESIFTTRTSDNLQSHLVFKLQALDILLQGHPVIYSGNKLILGGLPAGWQTF